jgi:hypothetical protein
VDMQSMSEVYGVEHTLGIKVEGVIYGWFVKGKRKKDEYLGAYRQDSPLIYGWLRKGQTPEDDEWAWRYGWDTEEINPKTGRAVGTKLGKGFRLVPIWQEYPGGVQAWVDDLAAQRVAPRHIPALESIFPQSMPVSRRADEIESWRRQTVQQENRTRVSLDYAGTVADADDLDDHFPQSTHSCYSFARPCDFYRACWTPAVKADPLGSGLYTIRTMNHPQEANDDE